MNISLWYYFDKVFKSVLQLKLIIIIFTVQVYPNITSNDVSVLPLAFPLGTPTTAEPPKEKPPPPPVELSDDEEKASHPPNTEHNNNSKSNLGRLDSTKRLKKDIRRKRSDFLGIEGSNDDSYLECGMYIYAIINDRLYYLTPDLDFKVLLLCFCRVESGTTS